jgi:hypothetical protein
VAINDFGGSTASNEIVLDVTVSTTFTLGFDALAGVTNGSPVVSHTESGITVAATAENWVVSTTFGNPAPFIQFVRQADQPALTGELTVTAEGALFTFTAMDVYSSITPIPLEIVGLRDGIPVFTASGTLPNPSGRFTTIANPHSTRIIDTLRIRTTNPATPCCSNPVGVDNIVVVR